MIDLKILYLIIVLILFSQAIAIFLRQYSAEKSKSIMIAIYLNLAVLISLFISNIFSESIILIINNNINFIMAIIGMTLIYTGYRFIFEFKNKEKTKNTYKPSLKTKEQKNLRFLKTKIQKNLALILLFISYYFSILINTIYVAPVMWRSIFELGVLVVASSLLLSVISYIILYKKIKATKRLYNGIFGFFLSLTGILYFVLYMFIPSLQSILTEKMTPLAFPEANMVIYIVIVGVIAISIGFLIKKSKKFRNLI